MTEAFLQYVWRHRMLSGQLTTYDGQAVIVENPGVQNGNAGPDFEGAVVTIGGVRWAGCVEVHVCSADWNAHRHFSDAAYNNVILHVVYEHDCDIRTQAGSALPVLEMKRFLPIELWNRYEELMNAPVQTPIACASRVREAAGFTWDAWLERLVVERLERKATAVSQMLNDSKGSWETACYWLTALRAPSFVSNILKKERIFFKRNFLICKKIKKKGGESVQTRSFVSLPPLARYRLSCV